MNDTPLQVALREVRTRLSSGLVLAVLATLTVVIAVSGPFGTSGTMSLPLRIGYWGLVAPATYAAGLFGSTFVQSAVVNHPLHDAAKAVLRALGSMFMVSALLFAFHTIFGFTLPTAWEIPASLGAVFVICLAIEVIGDLAAHSHPKPTIKGAPPILQRLPLDKRAALINISAVDHYIEVTTLKGSHLILMRLADAITEAAPTPGLQVHRSHWVALDQISRAVRAGDGGMVALTGGRELPISRSKMPGAIGAGLFAKSG